MNKVNWRVRFRNRIWLGSFFSAVLAIVYTLLDVFGIIPDVSEAALYRAIDAILLVLSLLGVIIDPTTAGIGDSARAQRYVDPWDDELYDGGNG